jgi:hypothetical protein
MALDVPRTTPKFPCVMGSLWEGRLGLLHPGGGAISGPIMAISARTCSTSGSLGYLGL